MKTFVKMSGITDARAVAAVPDGGAAGFVISVPDSPRNLALEAAVDLAAQVPSGAEVWAITRDPTAELVHRLFDEMGVDRIQIYGAVPPGLEFLETHHIVPVLPIRPPESSEPLPKVPPPEEHPILELDRSVDALESRSAELPDWVACRELVDAHPGRKLVLGGGLTETNVGDALRAVRPWGIDVSRGVEEAPGQMSPERMAAFVAAVVAAEATLG